LAESEDEKARRLGKLRDKYRAKRARPGDTPEAEEERGKHVPPADADAVKKRVGKGVIFS
jgi:hypothetical protein